MSKSIFELQNDEYLLKCLHVMRSYYSKGKRYSFAKLIISVLTPIVLGVLITVLGIKYPILLTISSLLATVSIFVNSLFEDCCNKNHKVAAKIQQYFDCYLYSLVSSTDINNFKHVLSRERLDELLCGAENKFDKKKKRLTKWYSNFENHPALLQIFYSQKENISWNMNLRKKYCFFNKVICIILITTFIGVFIFTNITFDKVIVYISLFIPLLNYYWRFFDKFKKENKLVKKIELCRDEIEKKRTEEITLKNLCNLQELIYIKRKTFNSVSDWFYTINKKKDQTYHDNLAKLKNKKIEDTQ